jgi:NADH:ubiquinone oxidoreductase subunit 2 (chain N)
MIPYSGLFSNVFQVLAILTMFFGNIVALVQTNVKRLFAYSSISQAGYIAIGFVSASQYGIEASIFQIFGHAFMIIGTFAIVLWLESKNIKSIKDYTGLSSRNGMMAFSLTIFMLSMIGIPPLVGFVGKLLLFTSAINSGFIALAVIAILNSFISVYYYAKVILSMYSTSDKGAMESSWSVNTTVMMCMAVVVFFGLFPGTLTTIASVAAATLFAI